MMTREQVGSNKVVSDAPTSLRPCLYQTLQEAGGHSPRDTNEHRPRVPYFA